MERHLSRRIISMIGKRTAQTIRRALFLILLTSLAVPASVFAAKAPVTHMDKQTAIMLLSEPYLIDVSLFIIKRGKAPVGTALDTGRAIIRGAKIMAEDHGRTVEYWLPIIVGIARQESGFHYMATSPKDALGIMQVHWPTWEKALKRAGVDKCDLYNQKINVPCGAVIFSTYLKEAKGSVPEALHKYYGAKDEAYAQAVLQSALEFLKFQKKVAEPFKRKLLSKAG